MVHMILYNTIISALITGIWCHDLLFFDEFQFTFDLNNANDWQHYYINTNLDNNNDESYTINTDKNLFSQLNYAKTCTQTIPLLLKQLCVHWKHDQGFKYNYETPKSDSQISDTNWYYNNDNNNRISDAKTSDKYYSLLDNNNNMRYIGDDSNWNEINYANSLSSFTIDNNNNNYFKNFEKGSFKQCRHSIRMRECVQFHLPSKKLTVNVKVARARKHNNYQRRLYADSDEYQGESYGEQYENYDEYEDYEDYEDEYYDDEMDTNSAYDAHGEFEYGDSMGYDNWSADVMKWKSFKCLDCMNNGRRLYEDYYDEDIENYDEFGDFTYLFNEYELDFDNDDDWYEISNDNKLKCSVAIPGFEHKLCVDVSHNMDDDKGAKISFAAANDDDIDYGYYDLYGYDQYYYNIDQLYKNNKRRIIEDDVDTDSGDDYDDYDDDDYDYLFGDDMYDENYEHMQQYYDAIDQEYITNLRNELSDIDLNFLDDDVWNDITTIYDDSNNKYLRKCKSFEVSHLCAIHSLSNPSESIKLKLKIGKYKFHRSANQKYKELSTFSSNANYINIYNDELNENDNENEEEHWIISDEILDLDDDEWNDESLWNPTQDQILTNMLRKIVAMRCRSHTYCLCQYVDTSLDGGRKHPCAQGKANEPQRVVHVMDDFVKTPKPEFIPLHDYHKSPLRVEFHYKPHIEHLHVVGGLPFFHRRNHRKRYMIPWYKYSRYENLRPKGRPKWLPHWMWREIGAHTHHDPRQVERIMKSIRHKGLLKPKLGNKYMGKDGLITQLKNSGNKIGDWFKQKGNWLKQKFSANDIDGDYYNIDDVYYYEYDENLADELDDMVDNSDTSNMVEYMFPIMEDSERDIQPVLESMNNMVGSTWNKFAENVGIRRRMEGNADEIYEDYDDENVQDADGIYEYSDYNLENEYNNNYNEIIDDWYDEDDGLNWIMLSNGLSDDTLYEFENTESNKMITNIITSSGKQIQRRCMKLFGRQLCICQFLKFINAQKADHLCYPKKYNFPKPIKKIYKKKKKLKPKKITLKPPKHKYLHLKKPKKTKKSKVELTPKMRGKIISELTGQTNTNSNLKPALELREMLRKRGLKPKVINTKKSKVELTPKMRQKIISQITGPINTNSKLKPALGLREMLRKRGLKPKVINTKKLKKLPIRKLDRKKLIKKISKPKTKFIKQNKPKKRKGPKRYKLWKGQNRMGEDYNYGSEWIKQQSNKIRKIVEAGLPKARPLWFPHYFWHWLHSAPHFHVLRHKRRVPWKASSAKIEDGMQQDLNSAGKVLDYNFYQYGDSNDVDYNGLVSDIDDDGFNEDNAMVDDYGDLLEDFDGDYDEDMEGNEMDFEDVYAENEMDFADIYDGDYEENDVGISDENEMGISDENEMDFEDIYDGDYDKDMEGDVMDFDGNYEGYMDEDNGLVMNALENGNDFIGKEDDINNEMWRIETMFLFMVISILFCILTFCFVWKSKWGALIRKLNQQRINRNKMIYDAKISNDTSNDNQDESSSLNISDVVPLNN